MKIYSIVFTWALHHPKPEVEEMVLHRRRRPSSIRLGSGGDWCRTRTRSPGRRGCRTGPSVWRKKKTCFNSIFSYIEYSCDGKSVIMKLKSKNNEGWWESYHFILLKGYFLRNKKNRLKITEWTFLFFALLIKKTNKILSKIAVLTLSVCRRQKFCRRIQHKSIRQQSCPGKENRFWFSTEHELNADWQKKSRRYPEKKHFKELNVTFICQEMLLISE